MEWFESLELWQSILLGVGVCIFFSLLCYGAELLLDRLCRSEIEEVPEEKRSDPPPPSVPQQVATTQSNGNITMQVIVNGDKVKVPVPPVPVCPAPVCCQPVTCCHLNDAEKESVALMAEFMKWTQKYMIQKLGVVPLSELKGDCPDCNDLIVSYIDRLGFQCYFLETLCAAQDTWKSKALWYSSVWFQRNATGTFVAHETFGRCASTNRICHKVNDAQKSWTCCKRKVPSDTIGCRICGQRLGPCGCNESGIEFEVEPHPRAVRAQELPLHLPLKCQCGCERLKWIQCVQCDQMSIGCEECTRPLWCSCGNRDRVTAINESAAQSIVTLRGWNEKHRAAKRTPKRRVTTNTCHGALGQPIVVSVNMRQEENSPKCLYVKENDIAAPELANLSTKELMDYTRRFKSRFGVRSQNFQNDHCQRQCF